MCVAMVIIHTKTLEKKAVDDVTSKESTLDLVRPKQAKVLRYRYERLTRRDSRRLPFPQGSRLPVTDSQERADLITKRFHSEFAFLGKNTGLIQVTGNDVRIACIAYIVLERRRVIVTACHL